MFANLKYYVWHKASIPYQLKVEGIALRMFMGAQEAQNIIKWFPLLIENVINKNPPYQTSGVQMVT